MYLEIAHNYCRLVATSCGKDEAHRWKLIPWHKRGGLRDTGHNLARYVCTIEQACMFGAESVGKRAVLSRY